jgi:MraZ protein
VATEKFLGRYFHSLDEKGRVAIPHKFRTILGGANDNKIIVTLSPDAYTYLDVYTSDEWAAIQERIRTMPIEGENAAMLREALFANFVHPAQEIEIDRQGRVLIPQDHREFAGIEKEVVYTGDGHKFRLWAKPAWEHYDREMLKLRPKLPPIPHTVR